MRIAPLGLVRKKCGVFCLLLLSLPSRALPLCLQKRSLLLMLLLLPAHSAEEHLNTTCGRNAPADRIAAVVYVGLLR